MKLALAVVLFLASAAAAAQEAPETPEQLAIDEPAIESPARASATSVLEEGAASWYGLAFHGRRTASGERFDMKAFTAAHPSLPFGTRVLVKNPANGRSVTVRINDRGPHTGGRIIDLSHAAAQALGVLGWGTRHVLLLPAEPARGAGR